MPLPNSFLLLAALRAAGNLFPAVVLALALAGAVVSSPAAASPFAEASSGAYEQSATGGAGSWRTDEPRVPDRPAECFEPHHSCGPGAIPPSHSGPLPVGQTTRTGSVTPRAPQRVLVPDVAPYLAASLSILFRNFRK